MFRNTTLFRRLVFSFSLLCITALQPPISLADIIVDPFGVMVRLEAGDISEAVLSIVNEGEEAVTFTTRIEVPDRAGRGVQGPRRDDPGDRITQYNIPIAAVTGLAWDGQWMWAVSYEQGRMIAFNPRNQQVERNVQICEGPVGIAFDGQLLWVSQYEGATIFQYDRNGNQVRQFNINVRMVKGLASDREQFIFMNAEDDGVIHVFSIANRNQVRTFQFVNAMGGRDIWAICWVPEHPDGQLWGNSGETVYEAFIDQNWNARAVQNFNWNSQFAHDGIAHDGENLWHGNWESQTLDVFDDGVRELRWFTWDPQEGEIEVGGDMDLILTFNSEGVEAGTYELFFILDFNGDNPDIQMSMVLTVDEPAATVVGRVFNAANNQPIAGTVITLDEFFYHRRSVGGGAYRLENLPLGDYTMRTSVNDFLPFERQLNLDEGGEVALNIPLLHSICQIDRENIQAELPVDENTIVDFTVTNPGNGPLTYQIERRLIAEFDWEPWERRASFSASATLGNDSRIGGVVFANDRYYISGDNHGNPSIYVLSREGRLLQTYEQLGEAAYGMQDLDWDGQLIWGAAGRNLYGFTPNGEQARQFQVLPNPTTSVAWDPDRSLIWLCGTTTDIFGYDNGGQNVARLNRRGLRIYGLAYWPEDPDGYCLYIFNNPGQDQRIVHKMNTQNGDTLRVRELPPLEGGRPNAAFITNELDVYSWVFLAMLNNVDADRLDTWQLDTRKDWMQIEPEAGVIESGEQQVFELTLSSAGFPPVELQGELAFHHDGRGRETVLPVTLNIVEPGAAERVWNLRQGWSMISLNIVPVDNDIRTIFQPLVDNNALIMLKDGMGRFYRPEWNFINIPRWEFSEGYQIRMAQAMDLAVQGNAIPDDQPVPLERGWQIAAYYPRFHTAAPLAFQNIVEVLTIAKDDVGHFYLPAFGFNNMDPLHEGAGYQVNVTQAVDLIWGRLDGEIATSPNNPSPLELFTPPSPYNMSILALTDPDLTGELEVLKSADFSRRIDDFPLACGQIINGVCGLAVWGDDPTTEAVEGALPGESLSLRCRSGGRTIPLTTENILGADTYTTDGLWIVRLSRAATSPTDYKQLSASPNPFNSTTKIHYQVLEHSQVVLKIFDTQGREVAVLVDVVQEPGLHSVVWVSGNSPAGIYLCRLNTREGVQILKVISVK